MHVLQAYVVTSGHDETRVEASLAVVVGAASAATKLIAMV
jgi:hypothetical protein